MLSSSLSSYHVGRAGVTSRSDLLVSRGGVAGLVVEGSSIGNAGSELPVGVVVTALGAGSSSSSSSSSVGIWKSLPFRSDSSCCLMLQVYNDKTVGRRNLD